MRLAGLASPCCYLLLLPVACILFHETPMARIVFGAWISDLIFSAVYWTASAVLVIGLSAVAYTITSRLFNRKVALLEGAVVFGWAGLWSCGYGNLYIAVLFINVLLFWFNHLGGPAYSQPLFRTSSSRSSDVDTAKAETSKRHNIKRRVYTKNVEPPEAHQTADRADDTEPEPLPALAALFADSPPRVQSPSNAQTLPLPKYSPRVQELLFDSKIELGLPKDMNLHVTTRPSSPAVFSHPARPRTAKEWLPTAADDSGRLRLRVRSAERADDRALPTQAEVLLTSLITSTAQKAPNHRLPTRRFLLATDGSQAADSPSQKRNRPSTKECGRKSRGDESRFEAQGPDVLADGGEALDSDGITIPSAPPNKHATTRHKPSRLSLKRKTAHELRDADVFRTSYRSSIGDSLNAHRGETEQLNLVTREDRDRRADSGAFLGQTGIISPFWATDLAVPSVVHYGQAPLADRLANLRKTSVLNLRPAIGRDIDEHPLSDQGDGSMDIHDGSVPVPQD